MAMLAMLALFGSSCFVSSKTFLIQTEDHEYDGDHGGDYSQGHQSNHAGDYATDIRADGTREYTLGMKVCFGLTGKREPCVFGGRKCDVECTEDQLCKKSGGVYKCYCGATGTPGQCAVAGQDYSTFVGVNGDQYSSPGISVCNDNGKIVPC